MQDNAVNYADARFGIRLKKNVILTIMTDEIVTKLCVGNVMNCEEERPMNLVHGLYVFRITGLNAALVYPLISAT